MLPLVQLCTTGRSFRALDVEEEANQEVGVVVDDDADEEGAIAIIRDSFVPFPAEGISVDMGWRAAPYTDILSD